MGVALGFRPTALADMPVRVQKVRYIPDNDDAGFVRLIIELAADLDFTKGIIEQIGVISGAFAAITAVKHETWSYEREIRLTHAQGKEPLPSEESPVFRMTALLPDDSPINWSEPLVRKTNGRQVGYLSFPYGRYSDKKFDARGAIETVILGPKCEASEADVECLLTAEGFRDFSVSRSRCQIR
jgi:hypothetical protein